MLRQDPELAAESYKFKNPPSVRDIPKKYRRPVDKIAERIKKGAKQDEVLWLLGSPDLASYASPGVRKVHGWDEEWLYETSAVGGFLVCFKDRCVVRAERDPDSPGPPRQ